MGIAGVDDIKDFPDISSGEVQVSKHSKSIEAMLNELGLLMPEPEEQNLKRNSSVDDLGSEWDSSLDEQNLKPSLEETCHSSVPVLGIEWDSTF
jgi:hypothetical protein